MACLVITPKRTDGTCDTDAKLERNLGRGIAIQIASELLEKCGAPAELVEKVSALGMV